MSEIRVDTISEKTSANGVAIDGVTLKDGGAALTGNLTIDDDSQISLGASADLVIRHNAANGNSFIQDTGTGGLTIQANSSLSLQSYGSSENFLVGTSDAGVKLYHNGNERLETTADGVSVSGLSVLTSNTPILTFIESDQSNKTYKIGSFGSAFSVYDDSNTQFRYIIDTNGNHIFNEGSQDCDFRIETNDNSKMFFVDGGNDAVIFNGNTSDYEASSQMVQIHNSGLHFSSGYGIQGGVNADRASINLTSGSGGNVLFKVNNSEVARFTSGGLAIGGTGTANTLDDYEEGTWTPDATFADSEASSKVGKYTKIGNVVIAQFQITFGTTSYGAVISVAGLPFTSNNHTGLGIGGSMIKGYYDGSSTNLSGYIPDNSSQVDMRENHIHLTHNSDKILGKNVRATLVYQVN